MKKGLKYISPIEIARCVIDGCSSAAAAGAPYCLRCADEIEGLEIWNRQAGVRREQRLRRRREFGAWGEKLVVRLTFPVAFGALFYLGWQLGRALVDWFGSGGTR